MKRKQVIILSLSLIVLIVVIVIKNKTSKDESEKLFTKVQRGQFDVHVVNTGELQAEKSIKIEAPYNILRESRIWEISIAKLVPEGTLVDSGDFIGKLDDTDLNKNLKEWNENLDKAKANFDNEIADTTINLSRERNKITNLNFKIEEAQITVDQSTFEPPSIQRKAKIDLERLEREYNQAASNYKLLVKKSEVQIMHKQFEVKKWEERIKTLKETLSKLTIRAPASGMVIYVKEHDGSKRTEGSTLRLWRDPTVAELPDFSTMISKTYINEIDISKIKTGQNVTIGVDAFPEKQFSGVVKTVANIGEQVLGKDAKVFEVSIKINGEDPILRPSMTTSNAILTASYPDTLFIPLESLHNNDSISYVIKDKGIQKAKQIILTGISNENHILIKKGLKEGERLYLSLPENHEKLDYSGEKLLEELIENNTFQ